LSFLHTLPGGGRESLSLTRGSRRGGGFGGATGKHGTEVCDLSVNPALVGLESFDGGGDDFVRELGP